MGFILGGKRVYGSKFGEIERPAPFFYVFTRLKVSEQTMGDFRAGRQPHTSVWASSRNPPYARVYPIATGLGTDLGAGSH